MGGRRKRHARGLVMPPGRRIPRQPPTAPHRPPLPDTAQDADVPAEVSKAAGESLALAAAIRACTACARAIPDRAYGTGYPRAPVMLVKDRPSVEDLDSGNAFASEADPLTKAFDALGIPLGWIYGSTAVRCGASEPSVDEVRTCSVHLLGEIEAVQPKVLVAFGPRAIDALRSLDGRCGFSVPEVIDPGTPTPIRADLLLVATEQLPEGVTNKDSKRRLWRDLQIVGKLIAG